ncbi:DUF3302 domain-containing protein [Flavobacterium sp. ABG]|uniref:DUF3302 domain-containing protein n=1 Tax=Flavobacterium sp. ABG TaxID=1423322 RepID=UPI0009E56590|nr:DUF3302 domain-containing protein [Flavobacterium sp. ABG]
MKIIKFIAQKRIITALFFAAFLFLPQHILAAEENGSFEDSMADVVSWIALILAPLIGIGVFLMVHILPEKIAEKKNHPQAQAIKMLCLLSLFFGGLLWPLAWLWAYSKPVFYKMAYGTDQGDYHEESIKEFNEKKRNKEEEELDSDSNAIL